MQGAALADIIVQAHIPGNMNIIYLLLTLQSSSKIKLQQW